MNKTREPLLHISRRGNISRLNSILIRLAAIVISVIICILITSKTTGEAPFAVLSTMTKGAFGSQRKLWIFLQNTSILLIISLAVTPAFRMRCWNLGAEGQVLAGCLGAAACMIYLADKLPVWLFFVVITLSSIVAGAIWAVIPAIFKARWNTNETLFTLMMNYVATQLVGYYVKIWENPKGSNTVGIINQKTNAGWLPQVYNKYLLVVIVAVILTIFVYIYMTYSKHGYEIAVVGESERTARYVGIKVEKVVLRTMLLSGAICGVVGLLLVSGINHTISTGICGGRGFTGVMVSWMSKFNPIVMILSSALLVFMDAGASDIATDFGLNLSFGNILTGIIIFFIIGSEFFINYRISFRHSEKEVKNDV
jgi:ABC-type uncharacterized transport system, permease component